MQSQQCKLKRGSLNIQLCCLKRDNITFAAAVRHKTYCFLITRTQALLFLLVHFKIIEFCGKIKDRIHANLKKCFARAAVLLTSGPG